MLAPPKPVLGGHQLRKRLSSRSRSRSRSPSTDVGSLLSDDEASSPETPQHFSHNLSSSSKPTTAPAKPSTPHHTPKVPQARQPEQDDAIAIPRSWRVRIRDFWDRNYGLMLVLIAQFFATMMNVTTGLLEDDGVGGGMHPFQILFARMSITVLISLAYMWWSGTPDWPFGAKGIRWLLVFRGVGGFWGVFGLYWSLQYLPLSDATVITFLAPTVSCWACSKFINEPFTRTEQLGGLISLAGVILIARPTYLFSSTSSTDPTDPATSPTDSASGPTPTQHLAAIGMAILGVFGAASAYTTIRIIGNRAHPLISVTYFSFWCTLVSTVALLFVPSIPFVLPSTPHQWMLLLFIGLSGFIMQFLLTAGLRAEKSGRATNMVYTQMLSALVAEKLIWGTSPGAWSLAGSALILGAAAMVAMQKSAVVAPSAPPTSRPGIRPDEEEEAGMQLLHDSELHQIGDDDDDEDHHDGNDNDIEMIEREKREKRGRSTGTSLTHTLNDDEPARISIDSPSHTGARAGDEQHELEETGHVVDNAYLDPPGVWQFAHARQGQERDISEDVSPHSPAVQRKAPVFWGR